MNDVPDWAKENVSTTSDVPEWAEDVGSRLRGGPSSSYEPNISQDRRREYDIPKIIEAAGIGGISGLAAPEIAKGFGKGITYTGKGISLIPTIPTKAVGTGLQALGEGIQLTSPLIGRAYPTIAGFLGSGASEIAGQTIEQAGLPKSISESARLGIGVVPTMIPSVAEKAGGVVLRTFIGTKGGPVAKSIFDGIVSKGTMDTATEAEKKAIAKLVNELKGTEPEGEAAKQIYFRMEDLANQMEQRAKSEGSRVIQKSETAASEKERRAEKFKEAAPKAKNIAEERLSNAQDKISEIGKPREDSDLGEEARQLVVARQQAGDISRSQGYKEQKNIRDAVVKQKEDSGQFVQDTQEYKDLLKEVNNKLLIGREALKQKTRPISEPGVIAAYNKIRDSIVSKRVMIDPENVQELQNKGYNIVKGTNPMTGEPAFYREFPTSFDALDDVRRKLGTAAFGEPAEGYEALQKNIAKDLYEKISKIQSKFAGESHDVLQENYEAASRLLEKFKGKTGEKYTGIDFSDPSRFKTNPKQLINDAFKSKQGVDDIIRLTEGDQQSVQRIAGDYVASKIQGKNVKGVEDWIKRNSDFLSHPSMAPVRKQIDGYLSNLRSAEGLSSRNVSAASFLEKNAPKLEKEAEAIRSIGERESLKITSEGRKAAEEVLGDKFAVDRVKGMIKSGKPSDWKILGPIANKSPDTMIQAVKETMADVSPKNMGQTFRERVAPALQQTTNIPDETIVMLQNQLDKISNFEMPQAEKLTLGQNLIGQVLRQYIVPRIFTSQTDYIRR